MESDFPQKNEVKQQKLLWFERTQIEVGLLNWVQIT